MATTGGHRSSVSDKRPEVREVREAGPLRSALHTFCEQSTTGLLTWSEIGDHDKLLRLLLPGVYFQDGWNSAVCWNKCTPTIQKTCVNKMQQPQSWSNQANPRLDLAQLSSITEP